MTIITKYLSQWPLETFISKGISLVLLIIGFLILKQICHLAFTHTIEKSLAISKRKPARQKTLSRLLNSVMNYALYFILIYWILVILDVPVSSLLAGAGLAGVAIGLGAQGFLSDVINGFFILLENQFDVGETVDIGSVSGQVSSVGIRTTQVRGFDGTLHFIPNRNITIVSNKSRGNMRAQIDLPIFAHTNLDLVTSIIEDVNQANLDRYPEVVGQPTLIGPRTTLNGQLVYRIDIFVENGQQQRIYTTFFTLYQEALIKAGISLPTINAMTVSPTQKN